MLQVRPFESAQRPLRKVCDWSTYKKLHASLPTIILSAVKQRVRAGEPKTVREMWDKRDKTFLALDL